MPSNFEKVRQFHEATDCPVWLHPRTATPDRSCLRISLIREEFDELKAAIHQGDLVGIADGLADLLYVVYGTGHEYGIQLDRVFEEVHRSNMSKLGDDGKPLRRDDGKILKGPNFSPPDIPTQLDRPNTPKQTPGLIYLASPYSHPDPAVQVARFVAVSREAARMMADGMFIYSPIAHTHSVATHGDLPPGFDFWEKYDRFLLGLCSEMHVLMLDGWKESKGVQAEIQIAKELKLPIAYLEPAANHEPRATNHEPRP